ncbi:MAG: CsbD family protein [Pirellulaceae bacterium]
MVTQQSVRGHWNELVGKLKQRWGHLTDDDLYAVEGDVDQLVGVVQRKTGETRESIEHFLDDFADELDDPDGYLAKARAQAQHVGEEVAESVQAGYEQAEAMAKRHPLETAAIAFGVGVVGGLVVGLMIRR